jgi:ATP-grasp domain
LYQRGSDANLYRRFMASGRGSLPAEVARLTGPAAADHRAVLAEEDGAVVGVASYECFGDGGQAEFAVFVDDDQHAAPVNTAAVEDLVLRLGRLADDLPEVAGLDLNPVLTGPQGLVAVDVKLRLAAVGAEPDFALRALRERG